MPATAEIAKRYFAALSARDLDAAVAPWRPGAADRLVGDRTLIAPDGIREYFGALFAAFPDFAIEVVETTTARGRCVVRWTATATFAGPARFEGFEPNHARMAIEGCDVMTIEDEQIVANHAYIDSGDIARQLGLLPPNGSPAQARLAALVNLRTHAQRVVRAAAPEPIAPGVWVLRGGFPLRTMNAYLIEGADGEGVTVFDAGIDGMQDAIAAAAARLGGIARIVLGHADPDHRGGAAGLDAPVHCHAAERAAAERENWRRDYVDLRRLRPYARPYYARMLPAWDAGPVAIAGTLAEGDAVAGFTVIELPGHAPGQIGLVRESDGLALCSDTVYTIDVQTGRRGAARVPHPAFDADLEQTRASIRKLADAGPSTVWAGHADPVTGDVAAQLRAAADAPVSAAA